MHLQGRVTIVWLSWMLGGACGVLLLLGIICYCRLMPRHQKSFDEQYYKESYMTKETHTYSSQEKYRAKSVEICSRPRPPPRPAPQPAAPPPALPPARCASSTALEEAGATSDALKTRSLPAAGRGRCRPLSADAEPRAHAQVCARHLQRMRREHAAVIALCKSRAQLVDADAVIVYDQRTQL